MYSVESRRVSLTFKNSPERNSPGLLTLHQWVLFRGSHLLQIVLKALYVIHMAHVLHVLHTECSLLNVRIRGIVCKVLGEINTRPFPICLLPLCQNKSSSQII